MVMKEEQLLSEAETTLREGEKRVKLVLATSHSIPQMGAFSLFGGEEYEEEPTAQDAPAPFVPVNVIQGEELLVSEYDGELEPVVAEEEPAEGSEARLFRVLEQILEEKKPQQGEHDQYVIRCDGVMSMRNGDIVITYNEEGGDMGDTKSEIVLHGGRQDMVSIVRTGAVTNTLVCERGRRHISAYKTSLMPFEVCVFTKECEHNVTLVSGGTVRLNYYVELRGTEMQHSKMRISVHAID